MIPRVSKAFFILTDPPRAFSFLSLQITNSGKSQKSQSSRAACGGGQRGDLQEGHGAGGDTGVPGVPPCWFWGEGGAHMVLCRCGWVWAPQVVAFVTLSWIWQDHPLLQDQDLWEELIPVL